MSLKTQQLYEFDGYLLNVAEKNLWRAGELVRMPPKVFETLRLLVEKRGEIVSKDEMLDQIWADSFVEESNLSQNVYTLRQIFGKEKNYIETVPKKGYRFIAPVKLSEVENVKIEDGSERNLILASQTKTHVIEETIVEESDETDVRQTEKSAIDIGWKSFLAVGGGTFAAFVIGFLSYHFLQPQTENARNLFADVEFKSLTDTGDAFSPTVSPDGRLIAYLKNGEERRLHLKDVESGNDVELNVESDAEPGFLRFAPDGKRIFFRTRGIPQSAQKIYEISYFGGQPKLVAENVWGFFSFSPDGEKIAFYRRDLRENKQSLIVKNLESGEEKAIVERAFPQMFFLHIYPAWSPNGRKIAFVPLEKNPDRSNIVIINLETGVEESFNTNLAKIQQIAWLPNRNDLLIIAKEETKGRQIWRFTYPTGSVARVTNDLHSYTGLSLTADGRRVVTQKRQLKSNIAVLPDADLSRAEVLTEGDYGHHGLFDLRWTANGKIVYEKRGEIHRDLWLGDAASGTHIRLTAAESSHNRRAAVSPDGRFIYFESDRDGAKNIWRINADGGNPAQITFGDEESCLLPAPAPDGEWLYFIKQDKNSNALWRRSLNDEQTEVVFQPDDFSFGNFLSVSPDGEYAAFRVQDWKKTDGSGDDEDAGNIKIGFLNLSNFSEIKFTEIDASLGFIRWTGGGKTFDYAQNSANGGQIWRRSLTNQFAPDELIFQLPNESIYQFDWSPNGKDLAIARGTNRSDIVVLEFEK